MRYFARTILLGQKGSFSLGIAVTYVNKDFDGEMIDFDREMLDLITDRSVQRRLGRTACLRRI